ncbi:MAG: SAM-dependent methyltransferase, partial [Oscillospiraceae bacterium]|nr:SAM-dependent methyltransferase [Oscillospiraceae bacterium]
ARAAARHEQTCSFEDTAACAARLLRDGGRFAVCHRPDQLARVLAALTAARLEPKRLAFVKQRAGDAPWLFLCEAQKNRRPGLTVLPDILPGDYPAY